MAGVAAFPVARWLARRGGRDDKHDAAADTLSGGKVVRLVERFPARLGNPHPDVLWVREFARAYETEMIEHSAGRHVLHLMLSKGRLQLSPAAGLNMFWRGKAVTYDVIIAGASFAGLAVAAQLRGIRVLLLDREPVGTGQTSACGTLVCTLRALGLEDAILQVHDRLVLHTPKCSFVYPVREPFCTFDYALLCRLLREQSDADFVQSAALGLEGNLVQTSPGAFRGDLIVDATGWRAVLGSQHAPDLVRRDRLNFGLEIVVPFSDEGLHFWYDPQRLRPMRITWAFPAGGMSRIGIGSYRGETRLREGLERFLDHLDLRRDGLHGGYFPYNRRKPMVGNLFLVGDAAGQCLGLTGEGIRPALFYGTQLGRLLRKVLEGELSLEEARQAYQELVAARRWGHDGLSLAQRLLPRLPLPLVEGLMALVRRPPVLRRVLDRYVGAFWLEVPQ